MSRKLVTNCKTGFREKRRDMHCLTYVSSFVIIKWDIRSYFHYLHYYHHHHLQLKSFTQFKDEPLGHLFMSLTSENLKGNNNILCLQLSWLNLLASHLFTHYTPYHTGSQRTLAYTRLGTPWTRHRQINLKHMSLDWRRKSPRHKKNTQTQH